MNLEGSKMNKHNQDNEFYNSVEKKFQTTMIGALAKFENAFGYLWGHNKDNNLTEKELYFRDLWENTRLLILNNGNHQLRCALEDIRNYVGSRKYKYHYKFYMKDNEGKYE